MSKFVLLDTGILGLATNPNARVNNAVLTWLKQLLQVRTALYLPLRLR